MTRLRSNYCACWFSAFAYHIFNNHHAAQTENTCTGTMLSFFFIVVLRKSWNNGLQHELNYLCMSFFQYFMETPGATDNAFSHCKINHPLLAHIGKIIHLYFYSFYFALFLTIDVEASLDLWPNITTEIWESTGLSEYLDDAKMSLLYPCLSLQLLPAAVRLLWLFPRSDFLSAYAYMPFLLNFFYLQFLLAGSSKVFGDGRD